MFKHILVPTDGSATALRAAQEVATLVEGVGGVRVTVVLAINPLTEETTDYDPETLARFNQRMRDQATGALTATCRVFGERGVGCETKIIEGDPVSLALANEAAQGGYDLIAMGSRGLGMQKNDLHYLGSVTEHVIRRVKIPVMVIPTHRD